MSAGEPKILYPVLKPADRAVHQSPLLVDAEAVRSELLLASQATYRFRLGVALGHATRPQIVDTHLQMGPKLVVQVAAHLGTAPGEPEDTAYAWWQLAGAEEASHEGSSTPETAATYRCQVASSACSLRRPFAVRE